MANPPSHLPQSLRPTLPPLRSLDLPRGNIQLPHIHELYDLNALGRRPPQPAPLHVPPHPHQKRQTPSTPSRPPSPTPPAPAPSSRPLTEEPVPPFLPANKFRLVPTTFEEADAVILILPPPAAGQPAPEPLLLVGPALQRLRHTQRQLAKGARVNPYRIVRSTSNARPSAVATPFYDNLAF